MVRNAAIVAGNSGEMALAAPLAALLEDETPVVRGAAVWAVRRLDAEKAERLALDFLPRESDTAVRTEWVQDL
jgi:epoxyqueuosine reductase